MDGPLHSQALNNYGWSLTPLPSLQQLRMVLYTPKLSTITDGPLNHSQAFNNYGWSLTVPICQAYLGAFWVTTDRVQMVWCFKEELVKALVQVGMVLLFAGLLCRIKFTPLNGHGMLLLPNKKTNILIIHA